MDVEDWDEEFGFSAGEDDSASLGLGAGPSANRIIGICAERFVANQDNKWDDDFAFDRSDGSGDLFDVSPLSPTGLVSDASPLFSRNYPHPLTARGGPFFIL